MTENVKIVSINNAPTIRDADNIIRTEITDLSKIVGNIDEATGFEMKLCAATSTLCDDLQHAHDVGVYEENDAAIDAAHALVAKAFDRLIVAEFSLNRSQPM
jgi:hypothetical protein